MSTLSEKSSSAKTSAKKFFRKLLAVIIVIFIGVMLFIYYANISEGTRAGMVVKISKKGAIFKTYEGQMDIGSFGAVKDRNQFSQIFNFSVEKDRDDIYKKLEEASLSGERVQIRYYEKYAVLPWRAETTYFVYEVIESGQPQQRDNKLE